MAVLLVVVGYFIWQGFNREAETSLDKYRLAVLPLDNISPDLTADEYFADGMTDELISTLSKLSGLTVIGRTSVMKYKEAVKDISEIGQELQVGTLLEGSVRKAGDQLKITLQLIDVKSQGHLWSGDYNRELKDVFALQSEVAQQVASALQVELLAGVRQQLEKQPTGNLESYQLYLKGLYFWNKRTAADLNKALEFFNAALEGDPKYARAYLGLAISYGSLSEYSLRPTTELKPKSRAAATRALELDETLAEARTVLAALKHSYDWDWSGADREFRRAIELNPNYATAHHWHGYSLAHLGRFDEAMAAIKRAHELDPLSLMISHSLAFILRLTGEYHQAIEQERKALELDPRFAVSHHGLGEVYAAMGQFGKSIEAYQKARVIIGDSSPWGLGSLGYAYARAGRTREAVQVLDELLVLSKEGYSLAYDIAMVYQGQRDRDKTFKWLEAAFEERHPSMVLIKFDEAWENLHSDPRFTELLTKMRFNQ